MITKLIKQVKTLNLNLEGKVVLTEAANGAYVVTPIIAAIAGAKVYAYCKDTSYGTFDEIVNFTLKNIEGYIGDKLDITFVKELTPQIIFEADIITNSGHLRPLNKDKLKYAKDSVVIPIMYEAWELRDADIDLEYCKERGFKLAATNERHPDVDVFNYLGDMAIKMIFDAGLTPYKNNFTLISNNDFGPYIAKVLSKNCEKLAVCDIVENKSKYNGLNIEWIGDFPNFETNELTKNCEAIIFTASPFEKTWIKKEGAPILTEQLKLAFKTPYILRYCGDIDETIGDEISFYPLKVRSGHMGILPSSIGFDPIIRLQSGGLKVGELLLKNENKYNNHLIAEYLKL